MGQSEATKRLARLGLNPAAIPKPERAHQCARIPFLREPQCDPLTPGDTLLPNPRFQTLPTISSAGQDQNPIRLRESSPCCLPTPTRVMFSIGCSGVARRTKRVHPNANANPGPWPEQAIGARGHRVVRPRPALAEPQDQILGKRPALVYGTHGAEFDLIAPTSRTPGYDPRFRDSDRFPRLESGALGIALGT